MKDYYKKFVSCCLRECTDFNELTDIIKRVRHNRAVAANHKLQLELFKLEDKGGPVVLQLLEHKDDRVRLSAAVYCLYAQIHVPLAKEILSEIEKYTQHPMLVFNATIALNDCKPWKT